MDLISVIVPVYNVKQYVAKCLESLLEQTYNNIEIIVVDDGSTDGSEIICDSYLDERIKVVHKENGGLSSARNKGLELASGRYICFVDSDDYVDVDFVSSLYKACIKNNADLAICRYHTVGNSEQDILLGSQEMIMTGMQALEEMLAGKIKSFAWNKLYKRELFDKICFPEGKVYEDVYIMHNVFLQCKTIVYIPNISYYYVWRDDSIMHRYSIKNTFDNYMALYSRLKALNKMEFQNIGGLYAELIKCRMYFEVVISKSSKSDIKRYKESIKRLRKNYKKLNIPKETQNYFSANELTKYCIFSKSVFLYRLFMYFVYEGKGRLVAENCIRIIRNFKKKYLFERKHEKAVWIVGLPEYNNLGDCAIGLATIQFIRNVQKDKDIFLISENDCYVNWKRLKKYIKLTDTVILQGGGNITDVYPDQQKLRKKILHSLRRNKIIIMPSTVYFTDTNVGKKEKKKTYELYKKCTNLTLVCREKPSYEWVKKYFPDIKCILTPDIVFLLEKERKMDKDGSVLICARNDFESGWLMEQMPKIKQRLLDFEEEIIFSDTVVNYSVPIEQYETEILKKIDEFTRASLVITDRLHGVIFSIISQTPCIAVGNFNHKIQGICTWARMEPCLVYAENLDDIMQSFQYLRNGHVINENTIKQIQSQFFPLEEKLRR